VPVPDRWSYRWDTDTGPLALTAPGPTLAADVSGPAPLPDRLPEVPWRGGIDLNPLDVIDPDTCRWLLTPHRPTPGAPDANASKDAAALSNCRTQKHGSSPSKVYYADHEPP